MGDKQVAKTKKEKLEEKIEDEGLDLLDIGALPAIGPETKKKLEAAGVTTLYDLCIRGSMELNELTGIGTEKASVAMGIAWNAVQKSGLMRKETNNPMELLDYRRKMVKIPLKCDALDNLLRGGFEPEAIYEVYGENGAGKTQICYVSAVEAIELFNGNVVWIDCEDTFRPERIIEIAMARGYVKSMEEAQEKYFPNLHYINANNTDKLEMAVDNISPTLHAKKPKLFIIDGAIGQYRVEYLGRGTLSERQQRLSRFMDHLKNISYIFNCTVLMTNQVQADPAQMFGDPTKPVGGNVVGHASTYRIYLKKSGQNRVARLAKSSKDPIEDVKFTLSDKGVEDI